MFLFEKEKRKYKNKRKGISEKFCDVEENELIQNVSSFVVVARHGVE
jgi:hypothetical protein